VAGSVVLEAEPVVPIEEVGPTEEPSALVVECDLRLGPRQAGEDEQQPEARLHRRLGRRFGELDDVPELRDALSRRVGGGAGPHVGKLDQPGMQRHVEHHDRFDHAEVTAEVGQRAQRRGGRQPAEAHHVRVGQGSPADRGPAQRRDAARVRQGRLHRIARLHVEAVQPRGGQPREGGSRGQPPVNAFDDHGGVRGNPGPHVESAGQAAPAAALEVPPGDSGPLGLGDGERSVGELGGNDGQPWHAPSMPQPLPCENPTCKAPAAG
jgi:hypothetical protein